jgi:dsRNA-specific ribonuclease
MLGTKTRAESYAPQTKILEGRTNISERVFEALFTGVSTRFGLHNVEKCFEKRFLKCLSDLPKSSFGRGKFQGPLLNDEMDHTLKTEHAGCV